MTPTEGVMKRFALLIALITTLFATPAVAHAAKVKLTGVPATLSQGDAFTVKGSAKTTVALTLSKDKKSDKRDVKLAKLKAKKGKFAGKVTIKATPGSYYVLACVGKACIAKAIKVTTKAAPAAPQPAPSAPWEPRSRVPPRATRTCRPPRP